jgi:hypothetical protein
VFKHICSHAFGVLFENGAGQFCSWGRIICRFPAKKSGEKPMKIETKLVVCSILAVSIGIAAIVPLAFFMSPAQAQTTPNGVPWFNVEVPFAYYSAVSIGAHNDIISYGSASNVGLNYTVNPAAADNLANARVEYFQIRVYSDLGPIEDIVTCIGANCTGYINTSTFSFARDNWFNTSAVSSSGGVFYTFFNGTLPDDNGPAGGIGSFSSSSCSADTTLPQNFLNAQNAQTIYLDISRLGYATFEGDNTIFTLADHAVIQHVELTKNGNIFSFGDVPANQIYNPFLKPNL